MAEPTTPDSQAVVPVLARIAASTLVEQLRVGAAGIVQTEGDAWRVVAGVDRCDLGFLTGARAGPTELPWAVRLRDDLADYTTLRQVAPARKGAAASVIQTWAAAPIVLPDGFFVGAVLAMDRRAVSLSPRRADLVRAFADLLGAVYDAVWNSRELEALNDAADERDERRRVLLAEVAHDLRSPLSVISGMASILERRTLDEDRLRLAARAIASNARRLSAMIDGLLDAEVRDLSVIDEEVATLDVAELVAEIAEEVSYLVITEDVKVRHAGSGTFHAPPNAVRRLLVNLAANAVRHTQSGEVVIDGAPLPGGVVLSVSDTGTGMSHEQVARLSTAFARGEESTGFGLGLSIVRRLVDSLGGDLEVTSVPGEGTTFRVRLPDASRSSA